MIYRKFREKKLSGLGLGMMRLPVVDGDDASIDMARTAEIIDYAYQNGINYFDTAWGYHNGNSELAAGQCLSAYPRESYYLASKFPGYDNSNMPKVKEIFEEQLKKCRTPYFDFYLFHNVYEGNIDDYLNPKFGIFEYLMEQKKNGRIRHLGFSAHGSIEVIRRFLDAYGEQMEFGQLQLNYMDWHFQKAKEKAELLQKSGVPIWVMEPLRGGKLAKADEHMTKELSAMRPEETVPAWAFRFLQTIPGVTMVLSGMSDMEQLKENIAIWQEDKPLSKEEFDRLTELADEETRKGGLPCTSCHYCTSHCPQKLPIPELIALYNEHKITCGGFLAPMAVGSMPEKERPANCVGCHSCEQVCPQQIKISDMMRDFSSMIGM
ncbi:aldo/keto reductase [[Clostridium] scindens]|uniref:aldo/keto reductase n=1 Tax=Clostridium scindens (strain JCM 10418 / VPI 12708) TaxID=29347 RepID=UPI0026E9CB3B|nr:aldo/keto reductase [[Clostridium] scindens]